MAQPTIDQTLHAAVRHHQAGELAQAEQLYRNVLTQNPNEPNALRLLGVLAGQVGRHDLALDLIKQAIAIDPNQPEMYLSLGNALKDAGRRDEAIAACRTAISLRPTYGEAHGNLCDLLTAGGQIDEAISAGRTAVSLMPTHPEAHNLLGNALTAGGQLEQAIASFRRSIELAPNLPMAHYNLANVLRSQGMLDEAIPEYRRALGLRPDYAKAHLNLAFALLTRGDFAEGWREYEWRWNPTANPTARAAFSEPQWDGQPLAGATLLLHAEQGFGDAIQFIRYLPLVRERRGKIIVACQPELRRLFEPLAADCQVVTQGEPLPQFDVQCPLLSLPRLFGTTLENIPGRSPYLHVDPVLAEHWRKRVGSDSQSINVGLTWAGSQQNINDRNRSLTRSALAPLAELPGINLFSLQKGDMADWVNDTPTGLPLIEWTEDLHDFADTAALIANLDLVISVDTAIVHLAGAMGKPVWVMLPYVPDWRWMLKREDSPWYPTMRLFRQPAPGDWGSVVGKIVEELNARAGK